MTILSIAGAAWHAFRTQPLFESVGRIEIQPQQTPNIGIQQVIEQSQSGGESTALQTEVRILQSDSVLFRTGQSLNLLDRVRAAATTDKNEKKPAPMPKAEITPSERRAVIGFIRGRLKVAVLNGTNLVEIRYQDADPRYSAAVVNRMVDTYSDQDLRSRYDRTMHVSDWLRHSYRISKLKQRTHNSSLRTTSGPTTLSGQARTRISRPKPYPKSVLPLTVPKRTGSLRKRACATLSP